MIILNQLNSGLEIIPHWSHSQCYPLFLKFPVRMHTILFSFFNSFSLMKKKQKIKKERYYQPALIESDFLQKILCNYRHSACLKLPSIIPAFPRPSFFRAYALFRIPSNSILVFIPNFILKHKKKRTAIAVSAMQLHPECIADPGSYCTFNSSFLILFFHFNNEG